jgi:hypothetical protein
MALAILPDAGTARAAIVSTNAKKKKLVIVRDYYWDVSVDFKGQEEK